MNRQKPKAASEQGQKVFVETYGCQMNVLDSELVQGQLATQGYEFVNDSDAADVVLLNTCSVRELSEHKVWSRLGRLGKERRDKGKDPIVGVLGCMAEREGKEIVRRMPHVDIVCGPSLLDQLPMLLNNIRQNRQAQYALAGTNTRRSSTLEAAMDGVETLDLSRAFSPYEAKAQAYVRITRGCNKFCSFCVVPYTRGPEVHRTPDAILEEVKRLVGYGVKEVTLLGQTVNHYEHVDGSGRTSFADLLWLLHEQVPDLPRLRFITSYPRDFGDDALDVMAAAPRICRYLHIPAQSGSNTMLKAMNRGYTVEEYMGLLERARARMPDIRLAGDMIVGYPNESAADHQASIRMLEEARYKSCFIFKYSPRPGTVSERRLEDNVPEEVKRERNQELLEVQARMSLLNNESRIGQVVEVLVEGKSKLKNSPQPTGEVRLGWQTNKSAPNENLLQLSGRTAGDEIVALQGPESLIGEIVSVKVEKATPLTLQGKLASDYSALPLQGEGAIESSALRS
ncbi:MAG: tRNA (N6-isopentenyl adenosine(37)-C2)-methylthiotransferase MiaB [Myxococcales bacterium]|nr:tRNA (N6-isopentenyl adenosine(37)-C2)-methylthiotransferase MiaB [Myxococcales bacterium]